MVSAIDNQFVVIGYDKLCIKILNTLNSLKLILKCTEPASQNKFGTWPQNVITMIMNSDDITFLLNIFHLLHGAKF